MKILHIADLHLDSAFSGLGVEESARRRAELRACFADTMRLAAERGVSLVLIAGDLFDTPFCSVETRRAVFDAIRAVGCPVVIAPGNHDHYTKNGTYADKALPENAYIFTSNAPSAFDFDDLGVSVVGYAFTSDRYEDDPLAAPLPLSRENVNILCAHAELGARLSKYAPISPNAIARAGFAYAALGHVHVAPEPMVAGATTIAYSGFMQGRSFDEPSAGGAYIVDLDIHTREISLERICTSRLRYEIERLDITSAEREDDVIAAISRLIGDRGYGADTALRVILCGSVPSYLTLRTDSLERALGNVGLALLQIRDLTVANFDLVSLADDATIRGELYRTLLPSLDSEDADERVRASLALRFALAALDKREFGTDQG